MRRVFLVVNVTMLVLAVFGAAFIGVGLAALPPVRSSDAMSGARSLRQSKVVTLMTGRRAAERLRAATERDPAADPREVAGVVRAVSNSVKGSSTVALVAFGVLALSGAIGLSRLRIRRMTILSSSICALGAAAGFASLAFLDVAPLLAAIPALLCALGVFGQLVATNLLPDANHPFVVGADEYLSALSPRRRRRYVGGSMLLGFGVAVASVVAMVALDGDLASYMGLFITGLFIAALPFIAFVRMRARTTY